MTAHRGLPSCRKSTLSSLWVVRTSFARLLNAWLHALHTGVHPGTDMWGYFFFLLNHVPFKIHNLGWAKGSAGGGDELKTIKLMLSLWLTYQWCSIHFLFVRNERCSHSIIIPNNVLERQTAVWLHFSRMIFFSFLSALKSEASIYIATLYKGWPRYLIAAAIPVHYLDLPRSLMLYSSLLKITITT